MNQDFILGRLSDLMGWDDETSRREFAWLGLMSRMKYDSYQDFLAGMRFIESLADWLQQFPAQSRAAAYAFVRKNLVFVGPAEMRHLVELFYPETVQPRLLRRVAEIHGIPQYKVWSTDVAAKTYQSLLRKTLFIELSDGGRIDIFRRTNAAFINNEQIVTAPRINKGKWDDLRDDLCKATKNQTDLFSFVYLVDDFTASGTTLLRKEDGKLKGKLWRFWEDVSRDGVLGTHFEEGWTLCVHHYISSKRSEDKVRELDAALRTERGDKGWFSKMEFSQGMCLEADFPVTAATHPEFAALIEEYYDDVIENEHMRKGGEHLRWDRCVNHRGAAAEAFMGEYFSGPDRQVGLIAGAGFDPRSARVAESLSRIAPGRVRGLFLREDRPAPHSVLMNSADANDRTLRTLLPGSLIERFDVFDAVDNAPVGSRRVIALLKNRMLLDGLTDLVIDCSALSAGICFSITRYCYSIACGSGLNIHLVVLDHPATDGAIESTNCGQPSSPHGFQGSWRLEEWSKAAKLWIPQLGQGKRAVLELVHQFVAPHAVCPILPFPATPPRSPDRLIEAYGNLFESSWQVDARDLVYAHEKSPVDLYRTILRIDDARKRVFKEMGGSQVILSPVGSKALALGMLMAALERDFAVVLVESLAYNAAPAVLDVQAAPRGELVHIWLHGEAYAAAQEGGQE
ncbi:MAG TPA: hypothetical protein VEL76_36740 [Gemmataceae bacterium]|nr:hypothetical protein [Gemmataceae bacterium]